MVRTFSQRGLLALLTYVPLILLGLVLAVFGALSPRFLELGTFRNILIQSSSTAIVAIGMTFVLLTAGVDLSVGAIMFAGGAVAGKLLLAGYPLPLALAAMVGVGVVYGGFNAWFITRLRIVPFIVTLATLYLGRGLGLWITHTRAMNLPESFLQLGSASWWGLPLPILVFGGILALAHGSLRWTPWGRQIYAVGHDAEGARKAGLRTRFLLTSVYLVSGFCAAVGGLISLAQSGAVSPTLGNQKEFAAIAAAVLGGTSLFGGRGQVFPGTVLGAVLIQTVESGLNIVNADPYLYPLFTSSIIFLAVLIDSLRHHLMGRLGRRTLRAPAAG